MPINKEDAQKFGINIIDSENNLQNAKQETTEAIKKLLPDLILDNKLNLEKLEELIGLSNTTYKNQGYELNFAGKALARAKADEETDFELKLEEKQSKNIENTENIVIKGDNIDVLKILKQNYEGKIKMIYIDPPYNTGNDGFIYNDNFKDIEKDLIEKFGLSEDSINFLDSIYKTKTHSGWLSFMYPRLKLAKDLLKEDGVIFISIDDNEQANLKIICDEIFGEDKTDTIIWRKSGDGRDGKMKNTTTFRKDHEYIIVAFKNVALLNKSYEKPNWVNSYGNPDNDIRGNYKAGTISKKEEASSKKHKNYYTVKSPSGREITRQFDIPKEEFLLLDADNRIYWGKNQDSVPSIKIFENEKRYTNTSSIILNNGSTTSGKASLEDIFGSANIFSSPKPEQLLEKIIQISTKEGDIILDFFAGSGTTGHAVMDLNKEDGGNRKFILAQWDEKIDEKHEAYNFCKENGLNPVISSITIERLNIAGEKIKKELEEDKELDVGYKVFSLKEKIKISEQNGQYIAINTYSSDMDILYNMIAKTDVALHEKIEKVTSNLYKVKNSYYIISNIDEKDKEIISNIKDNTDNIFINGFADINLENLLNLLNTNRFTKDNVKIIY